MSRPTAPVAGLLLLASAFATPLTAQEQLRHVLSFRPSVHAPGFANGDIGAFSYTIGFDGLSYTWQHGFGMCGGMAMAAADAWYTGTWQSRTEPGPQQGSARWSTLWSRQLGSLLPGGWTKVLEWQQRPDVGHRTNPLHSMKYMVPREWDDVRSRIDGGKVVPLVLIGARGFDNPTVNHQVLAYGYLMQPQQGKVTIYIYDSNHPNDDRVRIEFFTNHTQLDMTESSEGWSRTWRGFYRGEYDRAERTFLPGSGYGNADDGRPEWVGDFDGDGADEILRYDGDRQRMLMMRSATSTRWHQTDMGPTRGFGPLWDGRPFFVGDFAGTDGRPDGKSDIAFYYPGDGNLLIGRSTGTAIQWSSAGSSLGMFGSLWPDKLMWARDIDADGATDFVFYYPGDGNWWFGKYDGNAVQWRGASNTFGFGNLADGRPLWVEDFDGDGDCDVLFYYGPHHLWWLGRNNGGNTLTWSSVANTSGFGRLDDGRYMFIGDLDGDHAKEVVFYYGPLGNFHMGKMIGGSMQWTGISTVGFGTLNDGRHFFTADFDADHRDEILFHHPATNSVMAASLVNGTLQWNTAGTIAFAHPNEQVLLADVDGDRRIDLTWRSSNRTTWYTTRMIGTAPTVGTTSSRVDTPPVDFVTLLTGPQPNVAATEFRMSAEYAWTTTGVRFSTPAGVPVATTSLQVTDDPSRPWFRANLQLLRTTFVHPPQGLAPGDYDVQFLNDGGTSAPARIRLVRPPQPTLLMRNSVPANTASVAVASTGPNNGRYLAYLFLSVIERPSVLPGIVALGIGDQFTNLINLGSFPVDPVTGAAPINVPPFPAGLGLPMLLQAGFLPLDGQPLPAPITNVHRLAVM